MTSFSVWVITDFGSSFFLLLFSAIFQADSVLSDDVHLLSRDETKRMNPGERVSLECDFYKDSFNLFDNPILWRKTQLDEDTQMNMMGNLLEPFSSTKRFKVAFSQRPPRYRLALNITDVRLEDAGNYTCEINGPQNTLLGVVVYVLLVRVSLREIKITGSNVTDTSSPTGRLVFTENHPGVVRCQATGYYPPLTVSVIVGSRNVTPDLFLSQTVRMTGSRGMRIVEYATARWSNSFYAEPDDDGHVFHCHVTDSDSLTNSSRKEISVNYAPIIRCCACSARRGERNAFVRCTVKASPGLIGLYWMLDINGTIVTHGQVNGQYWTVVTDRGDKTLETTLFMYEANSESFRVYTIIAENSVALKSQDVRLIENRLPIPLLESSSLSIQSSNKNNDSNDNNQNNMKAAGYISYSNALNQMDNSAATSRHLQREHFLTPTTLTVVVLLTSPLNAHLCTLASTAG